MIIEFFPKENMFNSVLFVIIFSDKEDCFLTSVLSTLKNEQPIIINIDNPMKNVNETECKQMCADDSNCYGYIYKASGKNCSTYTYQKGNATVNITSTELKHKGRYM